MDDLTKKLKDLEKKHSSQNSKKKMAVIADYIVKINQHRIKSNLEPNGLKMKASVKNSKMFTKLSNYLTSYLTDDLMIIKFKTPIAQKLALIHHGGLTEKVKNKKIIKNKKRKLLGISTNDLIAIRKILTKNFKE